jgi:hypothetical protein
MRVYSVLRLSFAAIAIATALIVASPIARADELAEANKLLKSGQHQQALERVNKLLQGTPKGEPRADQENGRRQRILHEGTA